MGRLIAGDRGGRRRTAGRSTRSPRASRRAACHERSSLRPTSTRSRRASSRRLDFDLGLEEEFQILDPSTLALTPGFETLRDSRRAAAARAHRRRAAALRDRGVHAALLCTSPRPRANCCSTAPSSSSSRTPRASRSAATGTHPFSSWKDQEIIDTPHYRLVEERLKYVAWRNNTWAAHVHVGVRGLDRAVAVCDALRSLPSAPARALRELALHRGCVDASCTRRARRPSCACSRAAASPTCSAPGRSIGASTSSSSTRNCIQEFTQVWWAVRPHHRFGTVEVRICDAQTEAWQSLAISALDGGSHRASRAALRRGPPPGGSAHAVRRGEPLARHPLRPRREARRLADRGEEVAAPDALRGARRAGRAARRPARAGTPPRRRGAHAARGQRRAAAGREPTRRARRCAMCTPGLSRTLGRHALAPRSAAEEEEQG